MRSKSPAFSFYPKDWLSDAHVKAMTLEERGAYVELLCIYWLEDGLPSDVARLARLVGVPERRFGKLWPALAPCFRVEGDRLIQKRVEAEKAKQAEFRRSQSEKGAKGGKSRKTNKRKKPLVQSGFDSAKPEVTLPSPSPSSFPSSVQPPNPPRLGKGLDALFAEAGVPLGATADAVGGGEPNGNGHRKHGPGTATEREVATLEKDDAVRATADYWSEMWGREGRQLGTLQAAKRALAAGYSAESLRLVIRTAVACRENPDRYPERSSFRWAVDNRKLGADYLLRPATLDKLIPEGESWERE